MLIIFILKINIVITSTSSIGMSIWKVNGRATSPSRAPTYEQNYSHFLAIVLTASHLNGLMDHPTSRNAKTEELKATNSDSMAMEEVGRQKLNELSI